MKICTKGAFNLVGGIIKQAVDDYEKAYMGYSIGDKAADDTVREIERWFDSPMYKQMTDLDKDYILRKSKVIALDEAIEAYQKLIDRILPGSCLEIRIPAVRTRKGVEGTPGINYRIPPRLEKDLLYLMQHQLNELKDERKKVTRRDKH